MTDVPLAAAPSTETVRFRRSWRELLLAGLALVILWAVLVAKDWLAENWLPAAGLSVILVTSVVIGQFRSTELTPNHLVIRAGRRANAVAWSRVQGFVVKDSGGTRTLEVLTDDGKQTALSAPRQTWFYRALSSPAPFDADHQAIGRWWVAHRGPQWQPTLSTAYQPAGDA